MNGAPMPTTSLSTAERPAAGGGTVLDAIPVPANPPDAASGADTGGGPRPDVELAEIHDLLDAARDDHFAAEASLVTRLIRDRRPAARTLLDVGCGTAAHLVHFARMFVHVQGVDLAEPMLAVARRKVPSARLHHGDPRAFALPYRFDAVVCMSGAIARQRSTADVAAALRRCARHLWPGGVLVVDPWWFPETFLPGHVTAEVITPYGRSVARVSHTRRIGDESWTEVHYVVADGLHGIRHRTETFRHLLMDREQYEAALRQAGFSSEYLPGVQGGRGLFVGIWEGGSTDPGSGPPR